MLRKTSLYLQGQAPVDSVFAVVRPACFPCAEIRIRQLPDSPERAGFTVCTPEKSPHRKPVKSEHLCGDVLRSARRQTRRSSRSRCDGRPMTWPRTTRTSVWNCAPASEGFKWLWYILPVSCTDPARQVFPGNDLDILVCPE